MNGKRLIKIVIAFVVGAFAAICMALGSVIEYVKHKKRAWRKNK